MFIIVLKHGYRMMFYFNSNTTVPLKCIALVVWKASVDKMSFG